MVLKKTEVCDVEFHGESENQIRFRIAFFVLFGIHFEQHVVFTIFSHFSPLLAKIAPITLKKFKYNFAGACVTVVSNIFEK